MPADQPPPSTYWHNLLIDPTGAHLIDFDFENCRPRHATFTNTQFSGAARFGRAQFSENAPERPGVSTKNLMARTGHTATQPRHRTSLRWTLSASAWNPFPGVHRL